jgi:hypothetical protein
LKENVVEVLANHTAGDPMQEDVKWTWLTPSQISEQLAKLGTPVGRDTVAVILEELGFGQRQAEKTLAMGAYPRRDEQFLNIAALKERYLKAGEPVISMDTKKKEFLGNFYRPGHLWTTGALATFDHDFHRSEYGNHVVPHWLYDVRRNVGHITLGVSHDTSHFACDSLYQWWQRHGWKAYPQAESLLLLCDSGGSNNYRHYIFKEDLQRLVNRLNLPIQVAHYPPYCSKYNPIERRLFSQVTRVCRGVIFHTLDVVRRFMAKVSTSTGLAVTVSTLLKDYKTQRTASDDFLTKMPVIFDDHLPELNYILIPQ